MQNKKIYLDIESQIKLLQDKGLQIPNLKTARKYLSDIGYYKLINGYREPFTYKITEPNGNTIRKFYDNTSIDELYYLYKLDQDLKNLLQQRISEIEVKIKAVMSDVISKNYGTSEHDYLRADNFKPDSIDNNSKIVKFAELKKHIMETIADKYNKHKALTWYNDHYNYYPFWVLSNVLTFGTISLIYSKMKQPDQNEIAKHFGVKPKFLESALMILQLFRNACAHNEVIYNFKTNCTLSQKDIQYIYKELGIAINQKTGRFEKGVNDFLSVLIIFRFLLDKGPFNETVTRIHNLLQSIKNKVDNIMYDQILQSMGYAENYKILTKLSNTFKANK